MNVYTLVYNKEGDVELSHGSLYYPCRFEEKINQLAGEIITKRSSPIFGGLVHSFCILKDKWNIFVDKVIPHIGLKEEYNNNVVWDRNEESYDI